MQKYLSSKMGNFVGLRVVVTVIASISIVDHVKCQVVYHQEHGTHIFNTKCQFVSKNFWKTSNKKYKTTSEIMKIINFTWWKTEQRGICALIRDWGEADFYQQCGWSHSDSSKRIIQGRNSGWSQKGQNPEHQSAQHW